MAREISQRELRNDSGAIMRGLDQGESYVVTRNGRPVGELRPYRRGQFVPAEVALGAFATAAPIDAARFRTDVDRGIDQHPTPRA
jgi:antitoxin (DNA-binding transcriptional repressor) of toxin-antitoxin stability system